MLPLFCLCATILYSPNDLCKNSSVQTIKSCVESYKIEQANLESNLVQIANTVNLAYQRQPFNRPNYPRITADSLKELLQNEKNQLYVTISDTNEICGTVLLHGTEISMLSVHPSYQGRGLGLHLLQYVEQEAFKTHDNVYLKVIPLFQEKLIRYYESVGYKSFGEYESLSQEKLKRVQEQYHHHSEMVALIIRKAIK